MNEQLSRDLARMRRRIRMQLVEKHALMVGAVGAGVAAILLALSKWSYTLSEPALLWSLVFAGLLAGAVWGLLRRITSFAAARATERRIDMKERLSSAVALSPAQDEMVRALVEDAAQHINGIRPKDVFPHRLTRETAVFGVMLVVLLGLYYVPQIPALQSPTRREEVKVMKHEGERLRKLAKETLKRVSPENKEIAERVALNMERLGKKLQSGRMTRKQAMLAMKKLDKELKDAQDRIAARNMSPKSMAKAAEELKDMSPALARRMQERVEKELRKLAAAGKTDSKLEELDKRLKDLQTSAGKMSGEKMQQAENELQKFLKSQQGVPVPPELAALMSELLKNEDYRKASELMSELAKKLGQGKLSKMDMKNLEEQLRALAQALKGTDLNELAKKMREAAEQLAKMDPKEAAKLLAQANKAGKKNGDLALLAKMRGG